MRFRWQPLPPEQKEAVKTYVVNKIISLAASDAGLARDKQWITKLNLVLVQVRLPDARCGAACRRVLIAGLASDCAAADPEARVATQLAHLHL